MVGEHPPAGTPISYSRQYRRCGHAACPVCATGRPGHGPYWYAYWREDGRKRSRYIGREAPPEAGTRAAAEDAAAGRHALPLVRAQTLGGFALWLDGEALPAARWSRPVVAALFKCLLSARGHRLGRDHCIELLWPDVTPEQGLARLRATVHRLRRALGDAGAALLVYQHEMLSFDPGAAAWLDADRFEAAARAALAGRDAGACRQALAFYTGAYLPDDAYAEWAVARREELQGLHLALLLHLAALSAQSGPEVAENALRAVLAADRCHEEAALALMRLYAGAGRPHQAMRIYRRLADALREELDLLPGAETQALARTLTAARPPRAPAAPIESPVPSNLPAQLTSFVGRRAELAALVQALRPGNGEDEEVSSPLLTLTGPGGCGKTRLALQLADDLLEQYADGVWLVELAALQAAADAESPRVVRAVARALGLREEAGRPLAESLTDYLKPKRLLLVLDNCEHLVAACAALAAQLLAACRGLRILATSREALGVSGERPWPVPPLSLPETGATVGMLPQYEAVRLFLERARVQRPELKLAEENAPAIAAMCRCVDGLPLAIELAAARVGVLSIEGIAARLQQSIAVLKGGPRTVPPRQQTLRATLDWSYGLLTGPEQALLRRLSVFAGGCALEAAEVICAGGDVPADAVLDGLDGLARKSLVVAEDAAEPGRPVRYRLLEVVRQYAHEKLEAHGEAGTLRHGHAGFFLHMAEQSEQGLKGKQQQAWLAKLDHEHDNLRRALNWSLERGETDLGLRMAGQLWRFWRMHGHLSEGRSWLERLLASTAMATVARVRALTGVGDLTRDQGDYTRAVAWYEEGLGLARRLSDDVGIATALIGLGSVAWHRGEYARAVPLGEESLALWRSVGDTNGIAFALDFLGLVTVRQGDYVRGRALHEESLALWRDPENKQGIAIALNNLAVVAYYQGDYVRTRALLEESLDGVRESGDKASIAIALSNLGEVALKQGEVARTIMLLEESLPIWRELGDKFGIATTLGNLGEAAMVQGDLGGARAYHEESLALNRKLGNNADLAASLANLGQVAYKQGDYATARTVLEESLALKRGLAETGGLARVLSSLASVAHARRDLAHASSLHRESLELRASLGDKVGIAECLEGLAALAAEQGQIEPAARLLGAADAIREEIGIRLRPSERIDYERTLATARDALGEDAFAAAWAAGRAMPLEQAVAYARDTAALDRD